MTSAKPHMGAQDWATLLFLSVLWGGSFIFIEVALKDLPPFTLVLTRVFFAALILLAVLSLRGERLPRGAGIWGAIFIMAVLNNAVPFSLLTWGQTQVSGGLASILNATTPMFTVMIAHFATQDERASGLKAAGVALGFTGVAVMIGGAALQGLSAGVLGMIACVAAPVAYASASIYGRRFKALGVSPLATAAGQLICGSLALAPLAFVVDQPWTLPAPSAQTFAAMAALCALSTALAYVLFFGLLGRAGATNISLVTFLTPITAIILGAVLLGETLAPKHYVGMAFIAAGLACVDGRLPRVIWRTLRPRPAAT